MVVCSNAPASNSGEYIPFVEALLAHGLRRPDSVALTDEYSPFSIKRSRREVSYGELLSVVAETSTLLVEMYNSMPRHRVHGGDVDSLCVIVLPNSAETVALLFACQSAGIPYLYVDPATQPFNRVRSLLLRINKPSSPVNVILLTGFRDVIDKFYRTESIAADWPVSRLVYIDTDAAWKKAISLSARPGGLQSLQFPVPVGDRDRWQAGKTPLYVAYTSGSSTGEPTLVAVPAAAVWSCVAAFGSTLRAREGTTHCFVLSSSIGFDVHTIEIYCPLCVHGSRLAIVDRHERLSIRSVVRTIEAEKVTVLQCPPTVWRLVLGDCDASEALSSLQYALTGAEPLDTALAQRLLALFPGSGRVWNLYGTTEAVVWQAWVPLSASILPDASHPLGAKVVSVPCGTALPGCGVYVIPESGDSIACADPISTPFASGEVVLHSNVGVYDSHMGEEIVAGVASGVSRLFQLGEGKRVRVNGVWCHRTGDLGYWDPSGLLHLHGRRDFQIKVNGVRMHPEEVEEVLRSHEMVQQCAVTVTTSRFGVGRGDVREAKMLTALVVVDPHSLREMLRGCDGSTPKPPQRSNASRQRPEDHSSRAAAAVERPSKRPGDGDSRTSASDTSATSCTRTSSSSSSSSSSSRRATSRSSSSGSSTRTSSSSSSSSGKSGDSRSLRGGVSHPSTHSLSLPPAGKSPHLPAKVKALIISDLERFTHAHLSLSLVPRVWRLVSHLPLNVNQKVDRKLLAEWQCEEEEREIDIDEEERETEAEEDDDDEEVTAGEREREIAFTAERCRLASEYDRATTTRRESERLGERERDSEDGSDDVDADVEADEQISAVETKLLRMWKTVLLLEDSAKIGMYDNFFVLGGTSASAVMLLDQIQSEFGVLLQLFDIFNSPTVHLIAEKIQAASLSLSLSLSPGAKAKLSAEECMAAAAMRDERERERAGNGPGTASGLPGTTTASSSPLYTGAIPLNSGYLSLSLSSLPRSQRPPPLFMIHPAGGTIFQYYEIARWITDRDVVGIQGYDPDDHSVEDLAESAYKHIVEYYPSGPFALVGWSMGGLIAYDVAHRLQLAGHEVQFVGLLDAQRDYGQWDLRASMRLWAATVWRNFSMFREGMYMRYYTSHNWFERTALHILSLSWVWKTGLQKAIEKSKGTLTPHALGDIAITKVMQLVQYHMHIASQYRAATARPQWTGVPLAVLVASEKSGAGEEIVPEHWGEVSDKPPIVRDIPGNHYSICKGENARILANTILECWTESLLERER